MRPRSLGATLYALGSQGTIRVAPWSVLAMRSEVRVRDCSWSRIRSAPNVNTTKSKLHSLATKARSDLPIRNHALDRADQILPIATTILTLYMEPSAVCLTSENISGALTPTAILATQPPSHLLSQSEELNLNRRSIHTRSRKSNRAYSAFTLLAGRVHARKSSH